MRGAVTRARFPAPIDRDHVSADWAKRGYSCHAMTDRPGQRWDDFTHATNEVVTVVSGELKVIIAGEAMTAGPGDEVFIPAEAPHSVWNVSAAPTTWLFGYD